MSVKGKPYIFELLELDEDGRLPFSGIALFASNHLQGILVWLFYLASLDIGLHNSEFLLKSPLVTFASTVMGFCASVIGGITAFLSAWLIFGKFDFVKDVVNLASHSDFRVGVGFTFLLIPVAMFFIKIIDITLTSYKSRTLIFFIALALVLRKSFSVFEHIEGQSIPEAYFFSFCVLGIIYFGFIKYAFTPRRKVNWRDNINTRDHYR